MTDWATDEGVPPVEAEYDEVVVCPTCKRVARPDEGAEDPHLQPCPTPDCGYTQLLLTVTTDDEGRWDVAARWNPGEGAQLFLGDVQLAIGLAVEFWDGEEAEEERIDTAITQMRLQRQQEEN
jgi:hypothetical protein